MLILLRLTGSTDGSKQLTSTRTKRCLRCSSRKRICSLIFGPYLPLLLSFVILFSPINSNLPPLSISHRSLKHHFFLSQSAFITQFLDASLPELNKASKNASIVKLQSLLELSLRTSGGPLAENHGDEVKVVMSSERLYDFLNKVVNQNGDINEGRGGGGGEMGGSAKSGKVEEKKKDLIGEWFFPPFAREFASTRGRGLV